MHVDILGMSGVSIPLHPRGLILYGSLRQDPVFKVRDCRVTQGTESCSVGSVTEGRFEVFRPSRHGKRRGHRSCGGPCVIHDFIDNFLPTVFPPGKSLEDLVGSTSPNHSLGFLVF